MSGSTVPVEMSGAWMHDIADLILSLPPSVMGINEGCCCMDLAKEIFSVMNKSAIKKAKISTHQDLALRLEAFRIMCVQSWSERGGVSVAPMKKRSYERDAVKYAW